MNPALTDEELSDNQTEVSQHDRLESLDQEDSKGNHPLKPIRK